MVQFFDEIPPFLIDWIRAQQIFWVATAPLSKEGHATFPVWYEDLTGSGCETISHIRENGRITVYFNAFEGPPRIARLFGKGTVYEFGTPEYNDLIPPEKRKPGSRSVIMVDVHKVATSCGYAIPFFEFKSHRNKLIQWATPKETADIEASAEAKEKGLKAYWARTNSTSLDGLPGMSLLPQTTDTQFVGPVAQRMRGGVEPDNYEKRQHGDATGKLDSLRVVVPDTKMAVGFALGALAVVTCYRVAAVVDGL
ncbi:pyridoxamine phosphate oxidase [Moniliophthora roreri MCA 2997]|uniref:Pyridoxamine phosphate oxidase n=1 Tax=Moniliophthora roreri (strain MCA 2997) TaxID=1381753 RepID=V2XGI4_MONRO|nr:pyridoxamine phosphate oxidase [Moniliophthora roreri MCA 2997]